MKSSVMALWLLFIASGELFVENSTLGPELRRDQKADRSPIFEFFTM
jgi:hypothetical protein